MKYNIANPATGQQIKIEIDDDKINRHFSDRRMGSDVDGGVIREDLKGYTLRITGGNDRQGFAMKQGVLVNGRVRILLRARVSLYRPRRAGERKRKSVRGCICGPDIAALFLRVLEKGPGEVEGLTDAERPRRLGPKRAAHIRKAFVLRKTDDVRKYIVRRPREARASDGKVFYKAANIQRLITEKRVRRKVIAKRSRVDAWKSNKEAHVAYEKLLSKFLKEKKAAYNASTSKSVPEKATPSPSANQAKKVVEKKAVKPVAKVEAKKEAPKAEKPAAKAGKAGKGKK